MYRGFVQPATDAMKRTPSTFRGELTNVPRGFLMGVADVIPGVSGGTIALILGIYERLVTAISRFDVEFLSDLRHRRWRSAAAHVDLTFLVLLGTGVAAGILSLAHAMEYLLEHQQQHTYAVFFGLILASSLLVARMIRIWSPLTLLALAAGICFAWWVVALVPVVPPSGLGYVFLCGTIAICAMILPGISGSFILVILGKYEDIIGIIKDLTHGDVSGRAVLTLAVFAAGCAVGLIGFSKFLKWLLARHHSLTMGVLCGFMLGSLRKIWPFKGPETPESGLSNMAPSLSEASAWISLGLLAAALVFVLLLDRLASGKGHKRPAL